MERGVGHVFSGRSGYGGHHSATSVVPPSNLEFRDGHFVNLRTSQNHVFSSKTFSSIELQHDVL